MSIDITLNKNRGMSEISATMHAALEYAQKHGGKLVRYPGGFWARQDWHNEAPWFATPTVQGLVNRRAMEYTDWKEGRAGKFPIEATVKDPA